MTVSLNALRANTLWLVLLLGSLSPSWCASNALDHHYYIAPTGDDSGPGTAAHPWKTLQKAANTLAAGDTVTIAGGTYHERVMVQHSGTAGRPIRYLAAPGESVVIDGQNLPGIAVLDSASQSYLIFSGLTIQNAEPSGIGIALHQSDHVIIKDCSVKNCAWSGIMAEYSSHIQILHNNVSLACQNGGEETISIARDTEWCTIDGNTIHDTDHEGIDVKQGAKHVLVYGNGLSHVERQGLYTDAWNVPTYDIRFISNTIHDCGFGIDAGSEEGGLLSDVWVENNVIYDNHGPGMLVTDWGSKTGQHPEKDIYFINNTVYGNVNSNGWCGGMYFENADAADVVSRNNILSRNGSAQILIVSNKRPTEWTLDNNLLDGPGPDLGQKNVIGDPLFVDPAAGNFHLQKRSPAIAQGSLVDAPPKDKDGWPRPVGAAPDIGAYQHHKNQPHRPA
jgi:parallel beta-helix repeat protein